ncbi:alpha/beta hydrolase [Amycolatopsis samaneae]|uniref:Alpha/beta hydrolase n=1 Tax=Amycolatopsis samaneae TaxID=664691 RepID=A0ABW5GKZ0_9PSEU
MARSRHALAALAAAVALTSCSAPAQVPVETSRPTPSPSPLPSTLAKFTGQKLEWEPCTPYASNELSRRSFSDKSTECARLTVPLDYQDPAGDTITLGLLRRKAADPATRIGSLVVNPGGPGASGMNAAAAYARSREAAPLVRRFDLVGFDPRGVGASRPRVRCSTDAEWDADRASDSESDTSPAGTAKQLADARDYGAKCAQRTEHGARLLANIGTRDVVRDLDVLRAVLGDEKLTYLGYSYGTQLGAAYAEAHPDRVRAMLLDGAVDPAQDIAESLVTQMAGFQGAFTEFAKRCAAREGCALGRDPAAATQRFQQLVRPLSTRPVPAGNRKLSFEDAVTGTSAALYSPGNWPSLEAALAQLAEGRGESLLALADGYYSRQRDGGYAGTVDTYFAVRCVDFARLSDRAAIDAAHQRMLRGAPFLAGGTPDMSELDICSSWPVPPTSSAHVPKADGLPPPLVVSTTRDPATPYDQGVRLAKDIKGALLTFDGVQHTVFLGGNECVNRAGIAYLLDGTLPAEGTRCS